MAHPVYRKVLLNTWVIYDYIKQMNDIQLLIIVRVYIQQVSETQHGISLMHPMKYVESNEICHYIIGANNYNIYWT